MRQLFVVLALLLPLPVQAGDHILIPMFGFTDMSDNTGHTARGNSISFDDSNEATLGFKYLYMVEGGFAFGVNTYFYEKDLTTTAQATDADIMHVHGVAQYYFNHKGAVSPFLGLGLGFSAISFNSGILDDETSSGGSYELNGGVLFKVSETIGLQVEYKYTDFDIDDAIDSLNTNIDTDSHSVLVGVSITL